MALAHLSFYVSGAKPPFPPGLGVAHTNPFLVAPDTCTVGRCGASSYDTADIPGGWRAPWGGERLAVVTRCGGLVGTPTGTMYVCGMLPEQARREILHA